MGKQINSIKEAIIKRQNSLKPSDFENLYEYLTGIYEVALEDMLYMLQEFSANKIAKILRCDVEQLAEINEDLDGWELLKKIKDTCLHILTTSDEREIYQLSWFRFNDIDLIWNKVNGMEGYILREEDVEALCKSLNPEEGE